MMTRIPAWLLVLLATVGVQQTTAALADEQPSTMVDFTLEEPTDIDDDMIPTVPPTYEPTSNTQQTTTTRAPIQPPPQPPAPTQTPVATASPTETPVTVQGQVLVELIGVATELPDNAIEAYSIQAAVYFTESLGTLRPPIRDITVQVLPLDGGAARRNRNRKHKRHLRHLQGNSQLPPPLTKLQVRGSVTGGSSVGNNMDDVLFFSVANAPQRMVEILKDVQGNALAQAYFGGLTNVVPYQIDEGRPPAPVMPPMVAPPPMAPVATAPVVDNTQDRDTNDDGNDGLSQNAIIGIGAAVAFWIVTVIGIVWYTKDNKHPQSSAPPPRAPVASEPSRDAPATTTTTTTTQAKKKKTTKRISDTISEASSVPPPPTRQYQAPPSESEAASEPESASDYTPSQPGTANDNMSYTYSLDAGNVENPSLNTDTSGGIPTMTGGGESTTLDDQTTEFSARPNMVSRKVLAPPGKLGIVIDTTLEGPVVHRVNDGSPLDGLVFPGDIIVAIDEVDTRAMSASAITALMVKTAHQERNLTVLSEEAATAAGGGGDSTVGDSMATTDSMVE